MGLEGLFPRTYQDGPGGPLPPQGAGARLRVPPVRSQGRAAPRRRTSPGQDEGPGRRADEADERVRNYPLPHLLVPTLRVGTPMATLCVADDPASRLDAERRKTRSPAPPGHGTG